MSIVRCTQTSGEGQACTPSGGTVTGYYRYYAGPVGVTNTANRCVGVHRLERHQVRHQQRAAGLPELTAREGAARAVTGGTVAVSLPKSGQARHDVVS